MGVLGNAPSSSEFLEIFHMLLCPFQTLHEKISKTIAKDFGFVSLGHSYAFKLDQIALFTFKIFTLEVTGKWQKNQKEKFQCGRVCEFVKGCSSGNMWRQKLPDETQTRVVDFTNIWKIAKKDIVRPYRDGAFIEDMWKCRSVRFYFTTFTPLNSKGSLFLGISPRWNVRSRREIKFWGFWIVVGGRDRGILQKFFFITVHTLNC